MEPDSSLNAETNLILIPAWQWDVTTENIWSNVLIDGTLETWQWNYISRLNSITDVENISSLQLCHCCQTCWLLINLVYLKIIIRGYLNVDASLELTTIWEETETGDSPIFTFNLRPIWPHIICILIMKLDSQQVILWWTVNPLLIETYTVYLDYLVCIVYILSI